MTHPLLSAKLSAPVAELKASLKGRLQTDLAQPVSLTLPTPPSINEAFRNVAGKGRVRTGVYTDWLGHAGWRLREQRPAHVHGHVVIVISVERGSLAADIDNRIKLLLDLLVTHKVIDDDRYVVGLCAAWAPAASKLARIMILPADDYAFQFQLASVAGTGGWFITPAQPETGDTYDGPQLSGS